MLGGNPTLYGYVFNPNTRIDPFGLQDDIIENPNRVYEDAPYHGKNDTSVKSKAPIDGQKALDNSVQVKPTSPRRVGTSTGEFVVLDQTRKIPEKNTELYHGHVRSWDDLHPDMQNALRKVGLVDKKRRIKCG